MRDTARQKIEAARKALAGFGLTEDQINALVAPPQRVRRLALHGENRMQWPTTVTRGFPDAVHIDMGYVGHLFLETTGPQYIGTYGLGTCVGVVMWRPCQAFVAHFHADNHDNVTSVITTVARLMQPTNVYIVQPDDQYSYADRLLDAHACLATIGNAQQYQMRSTQVLVSLVVNALPNVGIARFLPANATLINVLSGTVYVPTPPPETHVALFNRLAVVLQDYELNVVLGLHISEGRMVQTMMELDGRLAAINRRLAATQERVRRLAMSRRLEYFNQHGRSFVNRITSGGGSFEAPT
ncbi:MAG TPA: hypothetical protein VGR95_17415 [Thermoanaerobaculia bacterium]|nr:hypothetical protein [Thermoanaerobaculia bacterium]